MPTIFPHTCHISSLNGSLVTTNKLNDKIYRLHTTATLLYNLHDITLIEVLLSSEIYYYTKLQDLTFLYSNAPTSYIHTVPLVFMAWC